MKQRALHVKQIILSTHNICTLHIITLLLRTGEIYHVIIECSTPTIFHFCAQILRASFDCRRAGTSNYNVWTRVRRRFVRTYKTFVEIIIRHFNVSDERKAVKKKKENAEIPAEKFSLDKLPRCLQYTYPVLMFSRIF